MYNEKYVSEGEGSEGVFNIGIIHVAIFFSVMIALEVWYKIYNRRDP